MNEAQVRLIKFGSSVAKIHSHPCEVCAVCAWLWWLHTGRTTHLRAVKKSPFVSCINAVKHMMVCVLTPVRMDQCIECQDNEESCLSPPSQPRWSDAVPENTGRRWALPVFPSGRAHFDSTGGTCSDRSQMIVGWVAAELFDSSEWPRELWDHSPQLAEFSICRPGGPASEGWLKPNRSPAPCPSLPFSLTPEASSEVVRPTPSWHDASGTVGITA